MAGEQNLKGLHLWCGDRSLGHLYKKLEVQTRLGAVMTALERLGLLRA